MSRSMRIAAAVTVLLAFSACGDSTGPAGDGDGARDGNGGVSGRIAFLTIEGDPALENLEMYAVDAGGSHLTRLTNHPATEMFGHTGPWSPDGARLVFMSTRGGGEGEIMMMDADGSNVVQLTNDAGDHTSPAWSGDGRRIAFESDPGNDIATIGADGSGLTRLTNSPSVLDWDPAWSPDGGRIAFVSDPNGQDLDVYTMAADGSDVRRLTSEPDLAPFLPHWSPDGSRIAFLGRLLPSFEQGIFVVKADGSALTRLTALEPVGGPVWAPDGRIAFASDADGDQDIYVVNADGSGLVQLLDSPGTDRSPAWSPDGGRLAFVSDRDGSPQIYVINADGTGVVRVTDRPNGAFAPHWRPE